ncbi:MAG: hypothetical protein JXX14_10990 [Deltaproteobacteria bacterium]|nr:hypothetical protein [Deltaproteobacteria bacterium]
MRRAIRITVALFIVITVPGGLCVTVLGASLGIGAFETIRKDALAIQQGIFTRLSGLRRFI